MEHKIKVGLVQINNSFPDQEYFPYSVGLLHAYALAHLKNSGSFEFLTPIYKRVKIKTALDVLAHSDIVFFSAYVWNIRLSLEIAKALKAVKPAAVIVFGGPEVPLDSTEKFMSDNPFIDIACMGEGEKAFVSILENAQTRNWSTIRSVCHKTAEGSYVTSVETERISDLTDVPSPYLSGVFDGLLKANPKINWVALWETNRGCPYSCAYCVWGAQTNKKVYPHDIQKIHKEVDWFSEHRVEYVFCCDANFGILKRDIDIVKYFIKNKEKYGYPKYLSVQNTKNSTTRIYDIYKLFSDAGMNKGVALALQSLNPETLKNIGRENISIDCFKELQELFNASGIETYTDVILGLPGETYTSFVNGVCEMIANGQHNRIQFNNLSILSSSDMADPQYQKKFGIKHVETNIINVHGNLSDDREVQEKQRLVVATSSMPTGEWIKTRVFGWMVSLLHFDKLLQMPFVVLNKTYKISYNDLFNAFLLDDPGNDTIAGILLYFKQKARAIVDGKEEYCESAKWLNIWWPADELVLIDICSGGKLDEFYCEAGSVLGKLLRSRKLDGYETVLADAIKLNSDLIKLPNKNGKLVTKTKHNVWEVYRRALEGAPVALKDGGFSYEIDRKTLRWDSWEQWCREVIWYGNKRGAYLYACKEI
jgi:radical SAM superfamily enzyme YgiQ (UPF0313 family)